jgi:hypothetical protein
MIDLDALIREAVAKRPSAFPGMSRSSASYLRYKGWSDRAAAAIIAVLDEHKHLSAAGVADPLPNPFPDLDEDNAGHFSTSNLRGVGFGCTRCHYEGYGSVKDYGWCLTLRGMARELGIEVPQ